MSKSDDYKRGYAAGHMAGKKFTSRLKNGYPVDGTPHPVRMKYQAAEVRWYRVHGKYPDSRIVVGGGGLEYVVGDFSWNRTGRPVEVIEPRMSAAMLEAAHEG